MPICSSVAMLVFQKSRAQFLSNNRLMSESTFLGVPLFFENIHILAILYM